MLFDDLLEEMQSIPPRDTAAMIKRMIDSSGNRSDLLWSDDHLYKLTPIKCRRGGSSDYTKLAVTYFNCLKQPKYKKEIIARLIIHFIADLPDVFNGTTDELFSSLVEDTDQEVLEIPEVKLQDRLKHPLVDQDIPSVYQDRSNPNERMEQVTDEHKFIDWLIGGGASVIRSTLGIISLTLLGLYTRKVSDVDDAVNSGLYLHWDQLFAVQAPPAKIMIPVTVLEKIKTGLGRESTLTATVLSMCLRRVEEDPDSKFSAAFHQFVAIEQSFKISHLEIALDLVYTKTGMRVTDIQKTMTIKKTLLSFQEFQVVWDQYKNFCMIMRYIAYCSLDKCSERSEHNIRTKYYRYAPLIDGRYFSSITRGNLKLRSFFFGYLDGIEECNSFMSKGCSIEKYVRAGRTFRLSIDYPGYEEVEREQKDKKNARTQYYKWLFMKLGKRLIVRSIMH